VFDGVLRNGDKEMCVHAVPFDTLSIGNLVSLNEHNIQNQIWIQSHLGANSGVWYEFGRPAKEYSSHWTAFHWLALLVKYLSDALDLCVHRNQKVCLTYFRATFAVEITRLHGSDSHFQTWMSSYGKRTPPLPLLSAGLTQATSVSR
jgi:hypothetical protein